MARRKQNREYLAQKETALVGAKHGGVGSGVEDQGKYNLIIQSQSAFQAAPPLSFWSLPIC